MDANICPGQAATPGVSWSKLQLQETPEVPDVLPALPALPELRSTREHKHFFLMVAQQWRARAMPPIYRVGDGT